jgi:hypothetical protein
LGDNLSIEPEAQINYTLGLMRTTSQSGELADGSGIFPGAYFAIDRGGIFSGRWASGDDAILQIDYSVEKKPGWLALHLDLGAHDLAKYSVVGLVVKSRAAVNPTSFRPCLRSGTPEGFTDSFFSKRVISHANNSIHIDAIRLTENIDVIPEKAPWRQLVLFFETSNASLIVQDMRVFIM